MPVQNSKQPIVDVRDVVKKFMVGNTEMVFDYSVTSVWIWLIIITILGIVASWFPSRGAIKVSARETLSYE